MTSVTVSPGEIRPTNQVATERRDRAPKAAEKELTCFFARKRGQPAPEGEPTEDRETARAIQACLDRLLTFHAGALALRFTPRSWSAVLDAEYGEWASLVVRMDCAVHPSDRPRSVEACEADAAARLEAAIVFGQDKKERARLLRHAKQHAGAALRAYVHQRRKHRTISTVCERGTP